MRLYRAGKDRTNTPPQPLDTSTPSFLGIRLFLASRSEQGIPLSMRGYDSIFLHRFGSWSQTIWSPLLDHIWNVYVGYTFMWDDVFFFLFFFFYDMVREKRGWNLNTHKSVSKQEIIVIIIVPLPAFCSLIWDLLKCAIIRWRGLFAHRVVLGVSLPSRVSNLEKNGRKLRFS